VVREPREPLLVGRSGWAESYRGSTGPFTCLRRPTPPYIASAVGIWFPNRPSQANADGQRPSVHQRQLRGSLRHVDLELQRRVTRTR
jgi:hypothetical protein